MPPKNPIAVPESGFEDPVISDEALMPVPPQVAMAPAEPPPAPPVSFAPPMSVEAAPMSPMLPALLDPTQALEMQRKMDAITAQMARLHAENDRLNRDNERLARTTEQSLTRQAQPPLIPNEMPAPIHAEYKLYFVGIRMHDEKNGRPPYPIMDLRGGVHTSSRFEVPVVFGASAQDNRPHAVLTRAKGDWLIANDAPLDIYGNPTVIRYQWAPEALKAFADEVAAKLVFAAPAMAP